ncbi:MAG: HU family DNA-binding protein [Bacteroidia bacterium]|nr:HU family DNA-binding protein [Bacteroidia bacterium]
MIQQVVNALREQHNLTEEKARAIFDTVINSIQDGLFDDGEIRLRGFGRFHIVERAERKGRNFKTGETILIPSYKEIEFEAYEELTDRLNAMG